MFMQGVEKSTPASSKTTVWGAALATDHPPCARGAIRKECKQKDEGATSTGVKAYLMRAFVGQRSVNMPGETEWIYTEDLVG